MLCLVLKKGEGRNGERRKDKKMNCFLLVPKNGKEGLKNMQGPHI